MLCQSKFRYNSLSLKQVFGTFQKYLCFLVFYTFVKHCMSKGVVNKLYTSFFVIVVIIMCMCKLRKGKFIIRYTVSFRL